MLAGIFEAVSDLQTRFNKEDGFSFFDRLNVPQITADTVGITQIDKIANVYLFPGRVEFEDNESRGLPTGPMRSARALILFNPNLQPGDWKIHVDHLFKVFYDVDLERNYVVELISFSPFTGRNPVDLQAFLLEVNIH